MILEGLFIGEVTTSWSSLNMDLKLFSIWDHSLDQESGVWELWHVFITRGWIINLLSADFSYGQRLDIDVLHIRLSRTPTFTWRNSTILHCFVFFLFLVLCVFTFVAICSCINLNWMFSILYLINPLIWNLFDYCTLFDNIDISYVVSASISDI